MRAKGNIRSALWPRLKDDATLPKGAHTPPASRPFAALFAVGALSSVLLAGGVREPSAAQVAAPADPRAAPAYAILDAACSKCHQTGKLTVAAPGGRLANILDLKAIAAEPHLVAPGLPEASRLYHTLLDRHRPLELPADSFWPNSSDIGRIRTWILDQQASGSNCALSKAPITTDDIANAIDATLREAGEVAGRDLRFITLSHFANACVAEAELEAYRQALTKLLNSVSWGLRPISLKRIDAAGTVLAFRLSDIGWIADHWSLIADAQPAGVALDRPSKLSSSTADPRPIRGDWLAGALSSSSLYDEVLGLPPTLEELVRLLGINRDGEIGTAKAPRVAVTTSAITRGPRVIERFQADSRRLWVAYDMADGTGERDVFERPLGYIRSAPERYRFRADGLRVMFTLPNGYLGYAIFDPDGRRLREVPASIETPAARWAGHGPSACISCHSGGQSPFKDDLRQHVTGDKFSGPKEIRDSAMAVYTADLASASADDAFQFRRTMFQTGIDPDRQIHGLEKIQGLARRYHLDVNLQTLAAEAGLTVEAFEAAVTADPQLGPSLALRLRQGLLSREIANSVLAGLRRRSETKLPYTTAAPRTNATMAEPSVQGSVASATAAGEPLRLSFWANAPRFKAGDIVTFQASTNATCHLTLISVDAAGKATVLFPSEFEPDNTLQPGRTTVIPAPSSQYQFRLRDKGTETVIGVCQTGAKLPPGIELDYERQRFTILGNWENFEQASFEAAGESPRSAGTRTERRPSRGQRDPKPEPRPEAVSRSAIRLVIE